MHRTTKRLASALLAAVLCAAAALPAGADYEPWTYEVDSVMGGYGVEYYSDVGFENPTSKQSTTTAQQSSGGVSTYSSTQTGRAVALDGADTGTAVDTGLGYTVTQLPGGITLYSPTDSGVSTYAMDSDLAVSNDVATYAAGVTTSKQEGNETVDGKGYNVYTATIPASIEFDDTTKQHDMTVSGTLYAYSELSISVKADNADATNSSTAEVIKSSLKCGDYAIPYTLTLGETKRGTSSTSLDASLTMLPSQWSDPMTTGTTTNYYTKSLSVKMGDTSGATVGGSYEDHLTFVMTSHRMKYTVTYDPGNGNGKAYAKQYACGASAGVLDSNSVGGFTAPGSSDEYEFLGWSVTADNAGGRVYAAGLPLVTMTKLEEAAETNSTIYTDSYIKDNGTLTVYAQWVQKSAAITECSATLYYEKNYHRAPKTGVAASGVNIHDYNIDNYKKGDTVTLTNVELQPGQTYYWTLEELEKYIDYETYGEERLPGGPAYYDPVSAAKVVVGDKKGSDGRYPADIYIGRKWICIDVNGEIIKFLDTDKNPNTVSVGNLNVPRYDANGNRITTPVGYVKVTYTDDNNNTVTTTGDNAIDYWMLHTYGSKVKIEITATKNYTVSGFRNRNEEDSSSTPGNTLTVDLNKLIVESSGNELSRQLSIWAQFKQVNAEGETTTAVDDTTDADTDEADTVDSDDAADTKADTKKDTAADTTESTAKADTKADDTTTTGSGTKTDTKADETTADAADEKTTTGTTTKADADTTPDDLMIWDADTMPALVVDDYDANELAVVW